MRTTGDLEKITPIIWTELTILNIPFVRSGVVLVQEEETEKIGIYLATPEGKAIASIQLQAFQTDFSQKIFDHWKRKETLIDHWNEKIFFSWATSLVELGVIDSAEEYLTKNPQQNLYLHFLPFLQGMVYVGNTEPLKEEDLNLVHSLAEAFSTAYARYEDFKKLEAAKQQVENTLQELRVTQKQLVQSEKMASLGELTAGIAHEIQNPLNFVNNFSEVNKELLAELKELIKKGNYDEVNTIADDVIINEEKINHHGERAATIVKSMLQHSRSSSGTKEPTDINALCDEYFRLAYHGLRARDKSFNAVMKTDFDKNIGNVPVIPQDLGRVVLNLITNAFYVVDEKSKQTITGYEPTVSVSTKKINNRVEIKVADNGNGIPQKILDKIFQPFFTTKPTGQGTGFGGEGSTFTIQLPIV
ncbi:MAG: hypothetical protein HYR66_01010 [Sphingobacteriales bacterium]|nr:hypothetical protein [Sphingobacteriales bacterium]